MFYRATIIKTLQPSYIDHLIEWLSFDISILIIGQPPSIDQNCTGRVSSLNEQACQRKVIYTTTSVSTSSTGLGSAISTGLGSTNTDTSTDTSTDASTDVASFNISVGNSTEAVGFSVIVGIGVSTSVVIIIIIILAVSVTIILVILNHKKTLAAVTSRK